MERLASIFTPDSLERRRRLYPLSGKGQTSARFVHYTSAEAALQIIGKKRMWMRNATSMSDYREVQHGLSQVDRFMSRGDDWARLDAALNQCANGVLGEATGLLAKFRIDLGLATFVTSISEHEQAEDVHGRLSMWRAFGGNVARVALVFNLPWHSESPKALKLIFSPVTYLGDQEMELSFRRVIENVERECEFLKTMGRTQLVRHLFAMFLTSATCSKHPGFAEEREWRAIYLPSIDPSPLMRSSIEVIQGVPQRVYHIPLEGSSDSVLADLDFAKVFDGLIIGPSPFAVPMYGAFHESLTKAGVTNAERRMVVSNIPIRT